MVADSSGNGVASVVLHLAAFLVSPPLSYTGHGIAKYHLCGKNHQERPHCPERKKTDQSGTSPGIGCIPTSVSLLPLVVVLEQVPLLRE